MSINFGTISAGAIPEEVPDDAGPGEVKWVKQKVTVTDNGNPIDAEICVDRYGGIMFDIISINDDFPVCIEMEDLELLLERMKKFKASQFPATGLLRLKPRE